MSVHTHTLPKVYYVCCAYVQTRMIIVEAQDWDDSQRGLRCGGYVSSLTAAIPYLPSHSSLLTVQILFRYQRRAVRRKSGPRCQIITDVSQVHLYHPSLPVICPGAAL